ncbi:hypothetical protein C1H46_005650 [Malus baccata]|uniref:Uncharacterized protein n=1 Tax=Malus baccata TaxID=106549 RepID=A0A540NC98_MALBA|nr:hypothetical protein C1H46_005650 [Malus baccata]
MFFIFLWFVSSNYNSILVIVRPSQVLVVEIAFDMHESSVTAVCRLHLELCVLALNILFGEFARAHQDSRYVDVCSARLLGPQTLSASTFPLIPVLCAPSSDVAYELFDFLQEKSPNFGIFVV